MRSLIGIPRRLFRLTERAFVLIFLLLYGFSLAAFSRQTEFSWPAFWVCYLGALGSYVYWLRCLPAMTRGELLGLLGTGLGLRLLFLFQDPLLSADLYRCIWEGLVTVGGKNPYLLPPAHPALVDLRPAWHHLINHPDYPAIYPPLTTLFNALVAAIRPTPFFYKSCLGFCDLLLTLVIGLRLKARARSRRYLLLYFLHPLAIIEIWGSGHHEALVMLAALIALHAQERCQPWLAVSGLVAAVFSKYFFLVLLREFSGRRLLPALVLGGFLLFLPFYANGRGLFFSLCAYLEHWDFNAGLYRLGTYLFTNHFHLRLVLAGAYLVFWLYINSRPLSLADRDRRALSLLAGLLLVSPTVHPWYGLWLLPLLVFAPSPALLGFVSLLPLSYIVLENYQRSGVWQENYLVTFIIYLPLLAVLGNSLACRLRQLAGTGG